MRLCARLVRSEKRLSNRIAVSSQFLETARPLMVNLANNGKPSGRIHDTHQPFQQKVKYTPQELSRLKADADANEAVAQQQRRQEEMRRQVKEHAARLQMVSVRKIFFYVSI